MSTKFVCMVIKHKAHLIMQSSIAISFTFEKDFSILKIPISSQYAKLKMIIFLGNADRAHKLTDSPTMWFITPKLREEAWENLANISTEEE